MITNIFFLKVHSLVGFSRYIYRSSEINYVLIYRLSFFSFVYSISLDCRDIIDIKCSNMAFLYLFLDFSRFWRDRVKWATASYSSSIVDFLSPWTLCIIFEESHREAHSYEFVKQLHKINCSYFKCNFCFPPKSIYTTAATTKSSHTYSHRHTLSKFPFWNLY